MTVKAKTILYVDDEEVNLFLFQRMFESRYRILTAGNAEEALRLIQSNSGEVDAVISDMRMPGIDGLTFIRRARQFADEIPYYVLTAFSYDKDIEKAIEDQLIRKAFTKPLDASVITAEFGS